MENITKKNIKKFWTYDIFYLIAYVAFLIASVKSYNYGNILLASISFFAALASLIMFAANMNSAKESIKKYREKLKIHFKEIIQIKDSPNSIALGFAIGTAIALLPTFGFGIFIGLGLILIFKRISKISLFAAFLVWNPFILAPLTLFEYQIGNIILKESPVLTQDIKFLELLTKFSGKYLLGNIIITFSFTLLSYVLVYFFIRKHREGYKKFVNDPLEQVIETVEKNVAKIDEKIQEKVEECKEACERIIEAK